jgi:hypothetical protein
MWHHVNYLLNLGLILSRIRNLGLYKILILGFLFDNVHKLGQIRFWYFNYSW